MNRLASISMLVLGTGWALAGLGALSSTFSAKQMYEAELDSAVKTAGELDYQLIDNANKQKEEISARHDKSIAKLEKHLAENQAKVDEVTKRFDDLIAEREVEKTDAEESGKAPLGFIKE